MADKKVQSVTMRVRIGEKELEVTGPANFVEKKINEFVAMAEAQPPILSDRTSIHSGDSVSSAGTVLGKGTSLGQLLKRAKTRTDTDKVLIAAYFLEHHEQLQSYTAAELTSEIKKAKNAPPSNTSDVVNKNIKKGFMMYSGDKDNRNAYVLTTDGEQAAEELLSRPE